MTLPLRAVSLDSPADAGFPFSIPALRDLGAIEFTSAVTFFVGENGSGKSTLLEALAWNLEMVTAGAEAVERDATLAHVRPLGQALCATWGQRTRRGFFLRAEDFFGYVKRIGREQAWHEREAARVRRENAGKPEGEISRIASPFAGSAAGLRARYGDDMNARSHGEQFLDFFQSRLVQGGLYLLDEPEVPLSPARQLALLSMLKDASECEEPSQFVVATHSPILMALPGARILSFDEAPIQDVAYEDLEHVRLTRDFLNRPEAFLRHL